MNDGSPRYIALFRGINVGRTKRVSMADLRSIFEDLGSTDIQTVLASGNVVFTPPPDFDSTYSSIIEDELVSTAGFPTRVTVLSTSDLVRIVDEYPLIEGVDNFSRLLAAILNDPADLALLAPLLEYDWRPDTLALGTRAAYLWCPDGVLASRLPDAIGRLVGDRVTTRNWSTILKLEGMIR